MKQERDTLLEFPCEFSVKAMGLSSHPDFEALVMQIVATHVPDLPQDASRCRASRNGKYLSVTVTFQASDKAQLDAIYYDLTDHNDVVMSL